MRGRSEGIEGSEAARAARLSEGQHSRQAGPSLLARFKMTGLVPQPDLMAGQTGPLKALDDTRQYFRFHVINLDLGINST